MQNKLTKIFQKAKYESSLDLEKNVWNYIILRNKRIAQIKTWVFAFMGFVSLAGLVPAFNILSSDFARSGFYEYASLVFSDGGSIFSYWKELSFSLAESLPVMSIVLSLSLVFILILSLKNLTKQIINNNSMGRTYGTT